MYNKKEVSMVHIFNFVLHDCKLQYKIVGVWCTYLDRTFMVTIMNVLRTIFLISNIKLNLLET